jgi:hypothetical protein
MRAKNREVAVEVEVEDDLAGLTREELAEEERSFAERAERVRSRVYRNAPLTPPAGEAAAGHGRSKKGRGG